MFYHLHMRDMCPLLWLSLCRCLLWWIPSCRIWGCYWGLILDEPVSGTRVRHLHALVASYHCPFGLYSLLPPVRCLYRALRMNRILPRNMCPSLKITFPSHLVVARKRLWCGVREEQWIRVGIDWLQWSKRRVWRCRIELKPFLKRKKSRWNALVLSFSLLYIRHLLLPSKWHSWDGGKVLNNVTMWKMSVYYNASPCSCPSPLVHSINRPLIQWLALEIQKMTLLPYHQHPSQIKHVPGKCKVPPNFAFIFGNPLSQLCVVSLMAYTTIASSVWLIVSWIIQTLWLSLTVTLLWGQFSFVVNSAWTFWKLILHWIKAAILSQKELFYLSRTICCKRACGGLLFVLCCCMIQLVRVLFWIPSTTVLQYNAIAVWQVLRLQFLVEIQT